MLLRLGTGRGTITTDDKIDNGAVVRIIAQHTRDYNDLDTRYKKLGAKHLTLMKVHEKTIKASADLVWNNNELISEMLEDVEINFIIHKPTNLANIKDRAKLLIIKWEGKKK